MRFKALCIFLLGPMLASAQYYRLNTVAGFGTFGGDGGPANSALVTSTAVVVDGSGNIYVSDPFNYRIRKIDTSQRISTLIGTGYSTFFGDGGPSAAAGMSTAASLALDASGDLYFTDDANLRIREITEGTVKTIAGNGKCGTVQAGMIATQAPLCDVDSVAVNGQGRLFFGSNSQVWEIAADHTLVLIAGTGQTDAMGDEAPATAAHIGYPGSLAFDLNGNLYLADLYNFVIREVTADKIIHAVTSIHDNSASTISLAADPFGAIFYVTGTAHVFELVQGSTTPVASLNGVNTASEIAVDRNGALYLSSNSFEQRLLKVSGGITNVIAGAYPFDVEGLPNQAKSVHLILDSVSGGLVADNDGNVYFVELDNDLHERIDKLSPSGVLTVLNTPAKLQNNKIDFTAQALAIGPGGLLYFSTFTQVYRLEANGTATLIAGGPGFPTNLGDGGPATDALITNPIGLAFDTDGNLYIAEPFAGRVRKVTPQNVISTYAGTGQVGYTGDGGLAANAQLAGPVDLKFDSKGNLYVADITAAVVRKITPGGIISTVAGNGTHGFGGDGGLATKAQLAGAAAIAFDAAGNLLIADRNARGGTFIPVPDNNRIRKVDALTGVISTITGGFAGYNGENILSTLAAMGGPDALASDAQGNVYMMEGGTERIRELTPTSDGVQITFVDTAGGFPDIAQNGWIEIYGANLAPPSVGPGGMDWSAAPEFASDKMPTQLAGVSVMVNGKAAYIYFVSAGQVNVLTPPDAATGPVTVVVTVAGQSSPPFTVTMRPAAPSFLRFSGTPYIVSQHADFSLQGPASMSVPGVPFTPAKPNETIILYAVGFGLPGTPIVTGSSKQFGLLPTLPDVKIGGVSTQVFAAIISPGLTQLNVLVPNSAVNGDNDVTVTYGGATAPGAVIAVQR